MKKIFILSFAILSLSAQAQKIKLESGKKITGTSTMSMDMDMGMGGQMKVTNTETSIIDIKGAASDGYNAQTTTTKRKMSQESMMGSSTFDSENKDDLNSENGKMFATGLNTPEDITINKNTGAVKSTKATSPEEEDANDPMSSLMGGMKSGSATAATAFFLIPDGKTPGSKWADSSSENGLKTLKEFEYVSLKDGVATIKMTAKTKGSVAQNAGGQEMEMDMDATSKSTINTVIATGLVQKNSTESAMEGTMNVAGQSLPVTMTMKSETVFQ